MSECSTSAGRGGGGRESGGGGGAGEANMSAYNKSAGGGGGGGNGDEGGAGGSRPKDNKSDRIQLKVKNQNGEEVFYEMKKGSQMRKLMNAYCDRQSLSRATVAFLFDGRVIRPENTPEELELEDGDEIDAMLHQIGGISVLVNLKNGYRYFFASVIASCRVLYQMFLAWWMKTQH